MSAVLPQSLAVHSRPLAAISEPEATLSALERLARSREKVSRWLDADAHARNPPGRSNANAAPRWLQSLRSNPLAAIAIDALAEWWTHHPLHTSARVAEAAARGAIAPLAQSHPVAVLGTAAFAGALLVWSRPWRWLLRPAFVLGVASQIASRALSRGRA